jgi:acetyl esterase/lipase
MTSLSEHGSNARRRRHFLPESICSLEARSLLSAFGPESPPSARPPFWGSPTHQRPLKPAAETVLHNVSFPTVDGRFEELDVYLPASEAPPGGRPVLVAIHGGGWRQFDKTEYGRRIASAFVARGYVVVAPNYELSAPGSPSWPVNLEDVQAAVRWVRVNAGTLGVDPNEIAAIGESAGANLAALLGTYSPLAQSRVVGVSAAVDAVIAFSTPTDLRSLYSESPAAGVAVAQFLGGSPQQVPDNYTAASPVDELSPLDPPMLLVQGLQDPLIPPSQATELAMALTADGVRNHLYFVDGGHALDFPVHYSNLVPKILEFLDTTWND